jgi:hypothetical protein
MKALRWMMLAFIVLLSCNVYSEEDMNSEEKVQLKEDSTENLIMEDKTVEEKTTRTVFDDLQFDIGWRRDWISAKFVGVSGDVGLSQKYKFDDCDLFQFGLVNTLKIKKVDIRLRGKGGFLFHSNDIGDYFQIKPGAFTSTYYYYGADIRGWMAEVNLDLGYRFQPNDKLDIMPLVGGEYKYKDYYSKHVHMSTGDVFDKLEYKPAWYGPYVGLLLNWKAAEILRIEIEYQFHMPFYDANLDINSFYKTESKIKSDWGRDALGNIAKLKFAFKASDKWEIVIDGAYRNYWAKKGSVNWDNLIDEHISKVSWQALELGLGALYKF